ncbi:2-desacetyl-2-hydroxyethyl bacteriochlorophyllide A dehydrogenase [Microcella alkaliphila]|uniref:2-desacetyl-2-hydroxyethyl bacteriochlorophyllide A dehydrogenase n=1 Tax=Microcella alkaliphila TaxID=279828 RepID=A0A4Q7TJ75_9MICO|nr:2-desacetyl-2-hydroxyethyl bacteriochlorophyllide A dehydrogenase [Microcella alkaliphila]
MGHLVRFTSPRRAEIVDWEAPVPGPGEVRITTRYSGISAGTELTAYRGTNPYMSHRWDVESRLFVEGEPTHRYPLDGWGYEEVGEVTDIGEGVDAALLGRRVWGAWGHRTTAVRPADWAKARLMPDANDDVVGIFAKIGAIALNAVLDADLHVGETVAVFGAGVPGQIVAQLARLNGARVVVVDLVEQRRDLARRLGAHETLDPRQTDVATRLKELTDGRGADVAIEISGSYQALHDAVRSVAYSSRVVAAGFYQAGGTPIRLGEEFHHNRVAIVGSQISGVAPALQHRWDEIRMSQTVLELEAGGSLQLAPLISHTVAAREAVSAFEMLDAADSDVLQVVLDYRA